MYDWRKMTDAQREEVLNFRIQHKNSWHRPHNYESGRWFHVTAACFEHRPLIGRSAERMGEFSADLIQLFDKSLSEIMAWVVLPNHYHILVKIYCEAKLKKQLGQLHGRNSHRWNVEEGCRGRTCFHGSLFKKIKSEAHQSSTLNYIHHNPVKHGYVEKWGDWPFGSARDYLASTPDNVVKMLWSSFPITGMGKGWDER
ncbi:transposase [Kiritimatiellaeota bacterium B1221]|nr:transposase [Kiritimatiellaeota bacterium B1221]